jgi:undecaprenyl-diphosphatase
MVVMQAIILGIIQGLTEFIPISSSAHLVIVPWLFAWNYAALKSLSFDVSLHVGTLLALLVFFAPDWMRLARAFMKSVAERKIGNENDRRLAWYLVIGCVPGGIAGVLAESKIEKLFHEPNAPIHGFALIAMGVIIALFAVIMFTAEHFFKHRRDMGTLSLKDALIIGCAQALAIFPGVSRSGATITAGLAMGLERATAARFSFLLSTPIIAGAGMKSILEIYKEFHAGTLARSDLALFPIGVTASVISGYFCIKFLLRFLQKYPTDIFVYYRWLLAVVVIAVAFIRG